MSQSEDNKIKLRKQRLAKLAEIKDSEEENERSRSRSREKKPQQKDQHSNSQSPPHNSKQNGEKKESQQQQEGQSYAEQDEMKKMMGFSSFGTSKNKDHSKSTCQAVFKNSKARRQYRQYMNRRGGFDRNLDKM